ncbi:biotin transport system permease protein [Isoptericola sp. CG 20/1183]|uniref:Biotin transport system permease protein n=1 Tax=Isoptericola halotolerans TaxID=300560 RepID=A0ABX5EFR5_9MICO|nr:MULTISPECIES: energy-coupling factor transporter transmembrane protein EcfT [Isoptericola]PRZ07606.1 biotin transport system permease protein [Isoptericola halotolerans]PRZ08035.1 biotin transport system permease protein [Isoptericola sp. CG 20/1183]
MSPLHRLGAGTKLIGLAACSLALLAVRSPAAAGAAVAGVLALYAVAGLGPRALWSQVRPLRWFVPCVVAVQWATLGPLAAAVLTTRLVALVALAGLVTLTTPTSHLLAALEGALGPLGRVGVDAERAALVLALAVRSVPVLADLAGTVRDARRARGREHDVRAFAVPLVVGSLRRADALGEALRARGLDD